MFRFLLTISVGLAVAAQAQAEDASKPGSACSSSVGRFQIVLSTITARDTFLLDTCEGKVWALETHSFLAGDPQAWENIPRIDNMADYDRFLSEHKLKSPDPAGKE